MEVFSEGGAGELMVVVLGLKFTYFNGTHSMVVFIGAKRSKFTTVFYRLSYLTIE